MIKLVVFQPFSGIYKSCCPRRNFVFSVFRIVCSVPLKKGTCYMWQHHEMSSIFRINSASYSAYFAPCWFLKTPANNNPPMIPIKIKATCSYKLSAVIIEEFKNELLSPRKDLLPGTSITRP